MYGVVKGFEGVGSVGDRVGFCTGRGNAGTVALSVTHSVCLEFPSRTACAVDTLKLGCEPGKRAGGRG